MSDPTAQDIGLVERILQKRIDAETGAVEYLIRWQGTDEHGNEFKDSWEPEHNILGEELIEEFDRRLAEKRSHLFQHPPTRANGSRHGYSDPKQDVREGRSNRGTGGSGTPSQQRTPGRHPDGLYDPVSGQHPIPPPSGYNAGHQYAYPSMHRNPQQPPWPYLPPPLPPYHHHHHLGYAHSKRDRSRDDSSKPSKRSVRSTDTSGLGPNATSGSNQDAEASTMQDGSIRQHDRRSPYTPSSRSSNGPTSTTIRSLKLDLDHEKAFFRSVIEKSTLVKDTAMRAELVSFLKNPSKSGLPQDASLLGSDTWLIELKEQQGTAASLVLALDIPKGTIKAMFIPEWMLQHQRQLRPGEGIVITNKSIVTAVMEGDMQGSGLYPPSASPSNESSQESSTAAASATTDGEIRSENDMEIDSEPLTTKEAVCGWKDCERTFSTMSELSSHVQHEHLQSPLYGSRDKGPNPTHPMTSGTHPDSTKLDVEGQGQLDETYQSLLAQIARTKEAASSIDQHIQDSRALYTSAVSTTKEHIRRLEARLEWESQKWAKYQEQTSKMRARGDSLDQHAGYNTSGPDNSESGSKQPGQGDIQVAGVGGNQEEGIMGLDKPMEAQSMNAIQNIQRQLANAKAELARLEEDNRALYEKRRGLDTEFSALEERHKQTMEQHLALKTKEDEAREELHNRTKSIEDCKAGMEQDLVESKKLRDQLQTMIGMLAQSSSSLSSPPPPPVPQPQSSLLQPSLSLSLSPLSNQTQEQQDQQQQQQQEQQEQQQQQALLQVNDELNANQDDPSTLAAALAPFPVEAPDIPTAVPTADLSSLLSTSLQPTITPMDISQTDESAAAAAVDATNLIDLLTKTLDNPPSPHSSIHP
ncbi:hypothetical protein B0O80DRAFT_228893 [Mortierella sp. GBAus27b]|nr:hypothetical protein B0O80DRAFT_228893 [Mortierella sp. GBAus27b]